MGLREDSTAQLGQFKRNTGEISFPIRDPILEELSWIRNTSENLQVTKLQREARGVGSGGDRHT